VRDDADRRDIYRSLSGPVVGSNLDNAVTQLYDCVGKLAPADWLLVSMYLEEMPSAEMGAVLGIAEGNVRVKLHRIKNQLREMLEKENYEFR
jgi:DNA-directed RNA polymerase specialized sigma24 family protein